MILVFFYYFEFNGIQSKQSRAYHKENSIGREDIQLHINYDNYLYVKCYKIEMTNL